MIFEITKYFAQNFEKKVRNLKFLKNWFLYQYNLVGFWNSLSLFSLLPNYISQFYPKHCLNSKMINVDLERRNIQNEKKN